MYKYDPTVLEKVNIYLKNFHLDEEGFFTEDDVDYFIADLPEGESFNYETGATKCVIIPKGVDYVIKIPFNGYTSSCSNCYESNPYSCQRTHCPHLPLEHGGGKYCDDYCAREMELYNKIVEKYPEFKDFFLPIEKVIEVNHYPVYVQTKGVVYENTEESQFPVQEKSVAEVTSKDRKQISAQPDWLAKCLEDLNNDTVLYDKFIQMLKDNEMARDLHMGNIGYYKNHAVIIDYGGFFDN